MEISLNTKTRLRGQEGSWPPSLVFVFKFISTFNSRNPKFFFMHVLKKDVLLLEAIYIFIISMTKLLDSDWLRGVQLFH